MAQVIITDENLTPVVQILTWFLFTASVLAVFARTATKIVISRGLNVEDLLVFASMVFSLGQSTTVALQAKNGFGKPFESLTSSQIKGELKSEYASTVLLIASLGLAKLSIATFIWNLTPNKLHRRINIGYAIAIFVWIITSEGLAFFHCHLPNPWDHVANKCINQAAWWYYVAIVNILTDVALVGLQVGITATLQLKGSKKAMIIGVFSCRLLVVAAAIVQLSFFQRDLKSKDPTLGYWRSTICNQITVCLSIITTCLPYAKTLLESLESGMMRVDDMRRRGEDYSSGSQGYELMDSSNSINALKRQGKTDNTLLSVRPNTIRQTKSWTVEVDFQEKSTPNPSGKHSNTSSMQIPLNTR